METISPELVLVDPELARRARAQLPDSSVSNGNVTPAVAEAIVAASRGRPVVGAGAVPPLAPTARSRPVRAREAVQRESQPRGALAPKLLLVAAGLCSFLLGVRLAPVFEVGDAVPRSQPQATRQETASELPRPRAGIGSALESSGSPWSGQKVRERGRRSFTREPTTRRSRVPPSAPKTSPGKGSRVPNDGGVATRLFVWLPSRDARYYHVQFLEGKRIVFEAWPTDPRVAVPIRGTFHGKRFAFTKGRYRWIVRPGLGHRSQGRYGEAIVRSMWIVRP